jgi:hypothetical protein
VGFSQDDLGRVLELDVVHWAAFCKHRSIGRKLIIPTIKFFCTISEDVCTYKEEKRTIVPYISQ